MDSNSEASTDVEFFSIIDFDIMDNFPRDQSKKVRLPFDYNSAYAEGFIIPSVAQNKDGNFNFKFKIKNKSKNSQKFSFKIYYQNESYKFPETLGDGNSIHPLCYENFYGSWEDTKVFFKETEEIPADNKFHEVTSFIRIVGNPRNEFKYYNDLINERWKRNPRVGDYSFLLVVATQAVVKNDIPSYISDITVMKDSAFVNPYYFFQYGDGKKLSNLVTINSGSILNTFAMPPFLNGIYINHINFSDEHADFFNSSCNQDDNMYKNAAFEQFINNVDPSMRFENIPVVSDIMGGNYKKIDYNWDKAFYRLEDMISVLPGIATHPCQTVLLDSVDNYIILKNPATPEGKWRKESVGIRTRHGFTYGKYRLKCKLTELLNKDNVWNGLTNAIWLLSQQGSSAWNNRRICSDEGYMATYWGGDNDKRIPLIDYSEIDFEILKTPPYCPPYNFPPVIKNPINDQYNVNRWNTPLPDELLNADGLISVACTNWDMACKQPENFKSGCNEIKYNNQIFDSHRWTDNYRALTQKRYESDDELFGSPFYYFEIDWRPEEIIWSIGPSPDKMRIVGYMNSTVTSIPNNQMTLIITQEYHNTKWWPGSPYSQENIPFPSKDLIGKIYQLEIL